MSENLTEIRYILDEAYIKYNNVDFIQTDTKQIPKRYTKKEDNENAGY